MIGSKSDFAAKKWFVVAWIACMVAYARDVQGQELSGTATADVGSKKLQAAAEVDQEDFTAQLNDAQQLFSMGKLPESWLRLRAIHEKRPDAREVFLGMRAVMDAHKRQGALNVGTSEKQIVDLLGTPHQSLKMPWGVRHVYGAMAVDFRDGKVHELINLIGATNELFDASHVVKVDLGSTLWHVGIRQKGDGVSTAFLFPEGESIGQWEHMITIERFVGQAKGKSLSDVMARVQEQVREENPKADVTVIQLDDTTTIFGVDYPAQEGRSAKQQLVRLWMAPRDVHRLAYTHQGPIPKQEEAEKWFSIFQQASVQAYDPSVSKTSQAFSPQYQVKKIAEAIREDIRKAAQFKPTPQSLATIAASDEAKGKLQAYCDSLYQELDQQSGGAAKPNQTEILVVGPALEELPGGYKTALQHLKADVKIYGFKYVVPGERLGMAYDGAFEVDGQWYFLPKAHRALR